MTKDKPPDTIMVVDYGSQYSQLIVRRVREAKVYCHLVSWRSSPDAIEKWSPRGIILSGGPNSVYDPAAPTLSDFVVNLGVPILGICYGMLPLPASVAYFRNVMLEDVKREETALDVKAFTQKVLNS